MRLLTITFLAVILLFSCSKIENNSQSKPITASIKSKLQNKPSLYPGSCPYPCTDTRCKAYLNGYCGGTTNNTIIIMQNSNNPYDYTGQQHNQEVDNILPNINPSSNTLESDVLTQDKSYIAGIGYSPDLMQNFYDGEVNAGMFPFSRVPELDTLGNILYNNGTLSYYGNSYFQQIYKLC